MSTTNASCGLTALYFKDRHGYVGFIPEVPHLGSQGRTLDEARRRLQEIAALVFEEERRSTRELTAGKAVLREPFVLPAREKEAA